MDKAALHEYVQENESNICSIVALKNGKNVYSDYWHGYQSGDSFHVMSVTKSVVSLLVGIALDMGLIKSVKQRVLDFFPDYRIKRGEKTIQEVTIEHLLTMTAPYKYRFEPWTKVCTSDDWTKAALDLLGGRAGITGEFKYSTLGIHILTGIIAAVSGQTTVDFANCYLFSPLEIEPYTIYEAKTAQEHKDFIMSREPKKNIWFSDPLGVATAGYGLCISALDMAKLGQLCLDLGEYKGRRVVSAEWIRESTMPRRYCDERFAEMGYGYLWWTPKTDSNAYAAIGDGGNVIYVEPNKGVVVAVNATFKPGVFDRVDFIKEKVLPLVDASLV